MHYKGIKSILRSNIKNKVDALWTWKKGLDEEFKIVNQHLKFLILVPIGQLVKYW